MFKAWFKTKKGVKMQLNLFLSKMLKWIEIRLAPFKLWFRLGKTKSKRIKIDLILWNRIWKCCKGKNWPVHWPTQWQRHWRPVCCQSCSHRRHRPSWTCFLANLAPFKIVAFFVVYDILVLTEIQDHWNNKVMKVMK